MEQPLTFRSEDMQLIQLIVSQDIAPEVVRQLGNQDVVEFLDLNEGKSAFDRPNVEAIRKCDELERRIRILRVEGKRWSMELSKDSEYVAMSALTLERIENDLDVYRELQDIATARRKTMVQMKETMQHMELLHVARLIFHGVRIRELESPVSVDIEDAHAFLDNISGTTRADQRASFERLIFRISRGNAFVRVFPLPVPKLRKSIVEEEEEEENSDIVGFVVICASGIIREKLIKMCQAQGATLFRVPSEPIELEALRRDLAQSSTDLRVLADEQERRAIQILSQVSPNVASYSKKILQEKAVYSTLDKFSPNISAAKDGRGSGVGLLVGEGWCPVSKIETARAAVARAEAYHGAEIPSMINELPMRGHPPTHIPTNKFTQGFQDLVDAYGVARYKEMNPGMFAVVTFPFLFGVMFGDIGHGACLTLFAAYLVLNEKKLDKKQREYGEIFSGVFSGRYVMLLMGFAAIYCGLVYNECFGRAFDLFGSTWMFEKTKTIHDGTYAFGVDPAWSISPSKLGYSNSLKMKLSIILGVTHMLFGIACKFANCLHHRNYKDFFFEAIPETVFLSCVFGYLVLLIFVKWATPWVALGLEAPSLLSTLLGMFLRPTSPIKKEDMIYDGQEDVQMFLLACAVAATQLLLYVKPFLVIREHRKGYQAILPTEAAADEHYSNPGAEDHEEFDSMEVIIHQCIHTIEFTLGCISNTASYLRLWALSLAHSQLSEVFWSRIVVSSLSVKGTYMAPLALVIAVAAWAAMTFSVLLIMEMMSASLHDVRLHWVEYQSKFYVGDGKKFAPLSFAALEQQALEDQKDDD